MLKNEVKKPSYLVGSRLGSILGDFLRKLGDFFSKSSGHTASREQVFVYDYSCFGRLTGDTFFSKTNCLSDNSSLFLQLLLRVRAQLRVKLVTLF